MLSRKAAGVSGPLGLVAALCWMGCGPDAEARYAGLSVASREVDGAGFRLRYADPPWKHRAEDPLEDGVLKSVPIGGAPMKIVPKSARVLEIRKQGASRESDLSLPSYRLEAVVLRCEEQRLEEGAECAESLADADYAARADAGPTDAFGASPRAGKNDFDQTYYEFLSFDDELRRYRRIAFFSTDDPMLSVRLFIEAYTDLGEREISELIAAFEVFSPQAAP